MHVISKKTGAAALITILMASVPGGIVAQEQTSPDPIVVEGSPPPKPAVMAKGPEVKGVITARKGDRLKITTADGNSTVIAINDATQIKTSGGIFGGGDKLASGALVNGLPVTIQTLQAGEELLASQIRFRNKDLKVATMIRNGTAQQFEEQTAATAALRGRMGDIDKYNIKNTINVNFDTGKAQLSPKAKEDLCAAAATAAQTDNALMLVVGYTDSTGSEEFNQRLSERRAASVINYLQQACRWQPYRMLTPTGMAEADPLASNDTPEGKAQNRRVSVNVLVSKSVDGL